MTSANSRSVRLIRKGDVITYTSIGNRKKNTETVVRVDLVFTLANGETVTLESTEQVDVQPPEDLSAVADQLAQLDEQSED